MKVISVVTACYNEAENVEEVYRRVRAVITSLGKYRYEHIFIDNASTDGTVAILKRIAAEDPNVKIIVNARNFGHLRSPMHALHQARGDAVISIVADLQDPPEMIADMVSEWEAGYSMVLGIKRTSEENRLMFWVRKRYYRLVNRLSAIETFENFTGFGLYDRRVMDLVKSFQDPYPYFRGMIAEIGLPHKKLYYDQPVRKRGITKNNFYTLYDLGMLGIVNHSKVPLRLTTFAGFGGALISFLLGAAYLLYKLLFWNNFSVGMAPVIIGLFFLGSIQLVFMGIVGEYVGAIHTQVQRRPFAIELERMNFEYQPSLPTPDVQAVALDKPLLRH
ncbi:MAG TPA: glycosyltransferase family 2 protein [Bryobacteraceae bacterium]|nr:glycosyltransferase family 2 protein [Bryobacteraceae bacterium]